MKIALTGPLPPYRGGISRYMENLASTLREAGQEVLLFSFRRQFPLRFYPGRSDLSPDRPQRESGCRYTLDSLHPWTWLQTAAEIRRCRPDALVIPWWLTLFAPMWGTLARQVRKGGVRVVYICHNVLPHERAFWDPSVTRWALRPGDGFIVQAGEEERQLLALLPGRPVRIVHHPVYDMFSPGLVSKADARHSLGLSPEARVLLFFGFVRPYKDLSNLLRALALLVRENPRFHLLVVGEFLLDKPAYLRQIGELNLSAHLTLVDRYVADHEVPLFFSAADVLTMPYAHISQSGAVQMAFGLGLPVIATRVGGLPEVIEEGKTGLLVPPQNHEKFADAIRHFYGAGLEPVMREEISRREKRSSWQRLMEALLELIREGP